MYNSLHQTSQHVHPQICTFLLQHHLWSQFCWVCRHFFTWGRGTGKVRAKALSSLPGHKCLPRAVKAASLPTSPNAVHLWMAPDACAAAGAREAHSTLLPSPPLSTATVCRGHSELEIHPSPRLKATGKVAFEMKPDAQLTC